jgi:CBS domain-containing protein
MSEVGMEGVLNLTVRLNMREDPPTVNPWDPVTYVVERMLAEDIGAIIVVERDNTPVGIITEKDLVERVVEPDRDIDTTVAQTVMSRPLITLEIDSSISEALELMNRHNIRRLVLTEDEKLAGITTERRLLEVVFQELNV